ncbi:hypothetical protein Tco_1430615 [Tanacetum coccineum]
MNTLSEETLRVKSSGSSVVLLLFLVAEKIDDTLLMNTLSEETPRVKSSSSSAGSSGKKREHSNIDITSSGKSRGEEGEE